MTRPGFVGWYVGIGYLAGTSPIWPDRPLASSVVVGLAAWAFIAVLDRLGTWARRQDWFVKQ